MDRELIVFLVREGVMLFASLGIMCLFSTTAGIKLSRWQAILWLGLTFYVTGVFYLTSTATLADWQQFTGRFNQEQINLALFSRPINRFAYLLNVCLFVPLGLLLTFWQQQRWRWWSALSAGFYFSLLIELSQLFNHRRSDVDDLLLNSLGAFLGGLLGWVIIYHWRQHMASKPQPLPFPWWLLLGWLFGVWFVWTV